MPKAMGHPEGSPPKLDARRHKILIDAIRMGNTRAVSASLAGIDRSTLWIWIARGRAGEAGYVEFFNDVKKAELEHERDLVGTIKKASKKSWQAGAWMLERRKPKTWGRKDRIEHKLPDLSKMTVEQIQAALRALKGDDEPAK